MRRRIYAKIKVYEVYSGFFERRTICIVRHGINVMRLNLAFYIIGDHLPVGFG